MTDPFANMTPEDAKSYLLDALRERSISSMSSAEHKALVTHGLAKVKGEGIHRVYTLTKKTLRLLERCCANEDRDINGGCRNCGDPCL